MCGYWLLGGAAGNTGVASGAQPQPEQPLVIDVQDDEDDEDLADEDTSCPVQNTRPALRDPNEVTSRDRLKVGTMVRPVNITHGEGSKYRIVSEPYQDRYDLTWLIDAESVTNMGRFPIPLHNVGVEPYLNGMWNCLNYLVRVQNTHADNNN